MAKSRILKKRITDLSFREVSEIATSETASIVTDYIRQYQGTVNAGTPKPGDGIFINWDRVLRTQVQTAGGLAWYDLYDELERDPHIASILQTRRLAVAGLDGTVHPASESPTDKKIAEFIKDKLEALENFSQDIYELLGAIGKGFAVSEAMWKQDADGFWTIDKIMNRPQRRIQFDATTREPRLRTVEQPYFGIQVPPMKLIVHRNGAMYENPFGDAIDQKLYWMWNFKKLVLKFWMLYLEVGAAPVPYVKYTNTGNANYKDEALEVAEQIRTGTYGAIPSNFEIYWAEAKNSMQLGDTYKAFEDHCNSEMTKCVLGQVLTTEASSSSGTGSKGLGDVHYQVLEAIRTFDAKAICGTINSTIVRWLVDVNFAGVKKYPRFQLGNKEILDRTAEATVIETLGRAGYKVEREYVETTFNVKLQKEEPKPEQQPGPVPPQPAPGGPPPDPQKPKNENAK